MIIAVDFDGTLVEHRFPDIGMPSPGAFDALREFQEAGASLILLTMRSLNGSEGDTLTPAVDYCRAKGIKFYAVNDNPSQTKWTSSRKVFAHIYIDDMAFGCPLRESPRVGGRPMVDWSKVTPQVLERLRKKAA